MIFKRMGEVKLSDLGLRPVASTDGSYWAFNISKLDELGRAHFYDSVKKAWLTAYMTGKVYIDCTMNSGHVVSMAGNCLPDEYQALKELWLGIERG